VVRHVRRGDVGLRVRVPDAEEEIGRRAVVLAVDDVADASDGQAEREPDGNGVEIGDAQASRQMKTAMLSAAAMKPP
jgi:hypothetical protein